MISSIRRTKIIATVGPACSEESDLLRLLQKGVDIFRINASHTDPDKLKSWIRRLRKVACQANRNVPILVDLQGPRVRTGPLKNHETIKLKKGDTLIISAKKGAGQGQIIYTDCPQLPRMVKKHDPVLLDNGLIELAVSTIHHDEIHCRVEVGGFLGENKGINLPNAPVTLPALTPKDLKDLAIAAHEEVDFIALSFVRSRHDVMAVKRWLVKHHLSIPVVAKIEKPRAVEDIDEILSKTDAVMIARGDLGIEMQVDKIPVIQKKLIAKANERGVPVITATQMLESMIQQAIPTRAEASDVANAVFDGTDAVMLSGETAVGAYPDRAVRIMADIIRDAEKYDDGLLLTRQNKLNVLDTKLAAISQAAVSAAKRLKARSILVFTLTGKTALFISKLGLHIPIIALTQKESISKRLQLLSGVYPLTIDYSGKSADDLLKSCDKSVLKYGLLKRGETVVILTGRQALPAARFMVKFHEIGTA